MLQCIQDLKTSICLTWHLLKPQKRCSACKYSPCRLDSSFLCWCTSPYLYSIYGYLSLDCKTSGPKMKAAGSEVLLEVVLCNVRSRFTIARRFRFALNRYIFSESANVKKVCQYQVIISNALFEESNNSVIFSKIFCN